MMPITISRFLNHLFFLKKTNGLDWLSEDADVFFYGKNKKKIWEKIRKTIGKQNTAKIQKSLIASQLAFSSRWSIASENLSAWRAYFQNNRTKLQEIISDIKVLSGTEQFALSESRIYLITDPCSNDKEINAWFSWMPDENFIVVEIPESLKPPQNLFPVGVLAHEYFHLIIRKNKKLFIWMRKHAEKNKTLPAKLSQQISNQMFLEELLISSFIPEGYLHEKHFHAKITPCLKKLDSLLSWRRYIAHQLHETARKYVDGAKQIDERYLSNLVEAIRQNTKQKPLS